MNRVRLSALQIRTLSLLLLPALLGSCSTGSSGRAESSGTRDVTQPRPLAVPTSDDASSAAPAVTWSMDFGSQIEVPVIWAEKARQEGRIVGDPVYAVDPRTGGVRVQNAEMVLDHPEHVLVLAQETLAALVASATPVLGEGNAPAGSLCLRIAPDGRVLDLDHVLGTETEPQGDRIPRTSEWSGEGLHGLEVEVCERPLAGLPAAAGGSVYDDGFLSVTEVEPGLAVLRFSVQMAAGSSERRIVGEVDGSGTLELWVQ